MELRHLRYFVVVADEKHITRAAQRLGMRQPPLSHQIRALETELGMELFKRLPRGVELTLGGAAFLKEAQAILASVDRAVLKAARAARGVEGTLSIGFTSSAAAHCLVPDGIRAYRRAYPGIALDFREGNAAQLTEAVAKEALCVAILRAPVAQPPGIVFDALLEEEMLLVLPIGHALLSGKERRTMPTVSLGSLADEEFILVRRPGAPGMYANLISACRQAGFTLRIAAEVNQMLTNIALVAAGVGISVVPASMRSIHRERVVYCRLTGAPQLVASMTLIYRQDETNPAAKQFVALMKGLAPAQF